MEVITEGDYESSLEYFDGKFNELADYFVDSHFVNRKEIKWKEIYDLININHISDKFEQMLGNNHILLMMKIELILMMMKMKIIR